MSKKNCVDVIPKVVILLTGCINPMGMSFTKLQDPVIRKRQYIDAIKFYLTNTENDIVFVENTGVDLSDQFIDQKNRLEVITFLGNNYNKLLGKGYGEMLILKHAFEFSQFIKKHTSICKITGRYKILNIKSILRSYSESNCNVMVDLPKQLRYGDSRIFIAEKFFFLDYLFKRIELINDSNGVYFEHILNNAVLKFIMENHSWLPLKFIPRIVAQSGTDSLHYDHSFFKWFPANIRKVISFKLFLEGFN